MVRQCSVAGTFYSHEAEVLEKEFAYFDEIATQHFSHLAKSPIPKALIVPHAGYVYSGFTASCAYRAVPKNHYQRVVVLGPSHRVSFQGVSAVDVKGYETPFGMLPHNAQTFEVLQSKGLIHPFPSAHQEHSTEVQFPLIANYLGNIPTLELVYGRISYQKLTTLVKSILEDAECLLIVSTDLSHFYTQEEANKRDHACIMAVETVNASAMDDGMCEACGKVGVQALLDAIKDKKFNITSLDYRTSGDITGEKDRVVGYYSALVVNA